MKIFMTVLMASIACSAADVSHLSQANYNYQPQQQPFFTQQHPIISQIVPAPVTQEFHTQGQYQAPLRSFQPSQQYLPALGPQSHSYQQQYSQPLEQQYSSQVSSQPLPQAQEQVQGVVQQSFPAVQHKKQSHKSSASVLLPMPDGLTVVPPPQFKTGRRYRPRVRVQYVTKKPIISKSFYIHTAPEETEEEEEVSKITQQPHKHYNVLFVKTPSQTNKAAALNFAKSLNEERTVVYVLSKKTTASDLKEALIDQPPVLHKPEVFFIKYNTPEEAAHAQQQIQAQYDTLGGSTTITDEGLAPVTSVVGSLDEDEEEEDVNEVEKNQEASEQVDELSAQQQQQQQQPIVVDQSAQYGQPSANNQYLPPNARY